LKAEEDLLVAASQIQGQKVEAAIRTASQNRWKEAKPEAVKLVRRMLDAIDEYKSALTAYSKLQDEFKNEGSQPIVPGFAWPKMTLQNLRAAEQGVEFRIQPLGLGEALKK
jgi:hypothetical protein